MAILDGFSLFSLSHPNTCVGCFGGHSSGHEHDFVLAHDQDLLLDGIRGSEGLNVPLGKGPTGVSHHPRSAGSGGDPSRTGGCLLWRLHPSSATKSRAFQEWGTNTSVGKSHWPEDWG